jgi:hypothetical protein
MTQSLKDTVPRVNDLLQNQPPGRARHSVRAVWTILRSAARTGMCLASRGHPGRSALHALQPLEDFGARSSVAAAAAWKAARR